MTRACIGLGSNLAHPRRQLAHAVRLLARLPRTRLCALSPNYLSSPVGCALPQPDFVNAVALVETALPPRALLRALLAIEHRRLRRRQPETRNAPRTLDLDLLLYGGLRMRTPRLTLPHPRMHERAFVLRPLRDVAPHVSIPGRGLARWGLRATAGQRIARTRSHPPR